MMNSMVGIGKGSSQLSVWENDDDEPESGWNLMQGALNMDSSLLNFPRPLNFLVCVVGWTWDASGISNKLLNSFMF